MHHYDIAAKVLIESCRDELIRQFMGIDIRESRLIDQLPQETVSVKRSDFPVLFTDTAGDSRIAVVELQTEWKAYIPLNLLDYRTRYLLKHDLPVVSCIVLLRPSSTAADRYEDEEVSFRYRLVKIYEMDARSVVDHGPVCLLPFVPLMKHGVKLAERADAQIYDSPKTKAQKADMLTSMAILSGLISQELPSLLIARRRDIMIESAAYDIIMDEGRKKGIEEGIKEGIKEGILIGERSGVLDSVEFILETKFGIDGVFLMNRIRAVEDVETLRLIRDAIKAAKSVEELERFLEKRKLA